MEEGSLIALATQTVGQSRYVIHAVGRQEEGLYEHGDRGEDAGHAVDGLTPVAVAVLIGQGPVAEQRVGKGGVTLVARHMPVVVADIFASEALDDNHHDILPLEGRIALAASVNGREYGGHLRLVSKVGNNLEIVFANGSYECERCIEDQPHFRRTVTEVIGI